MRICLRRTLPQRVFFLGSDPNCYHPAMPEIKSFVRPSVLTCLALVYGCAGQTVQTVRVSSGTQFMVTGDATALYFDMQGILWRMPANDDEGRAIALTDARDDIRRPQLSPDGQWLATQSFATGTWDIVVMRTDGSNRRNLTQSRHDDREPAWSGNGQAILFSSDRTGNEDIWSIAVATGELTQLTFAAADDYAPAMLGTDLLFISDRSTRPALYRQTSNAEPEQLAVAPAGRMHAPRVSPDKQTIAWVQAIQRNSFPGVAINELVSYDIATGATRTLSRQASDVFAAAPAWLDDDTLLYTADGQIQRINQLTGNTRTLPFSAELPLQKSNFIPRTPLAFKQVEQPLLGIVDPVMLPDNSIVFTALGDLWRLGTSGELQQLTDDAFVERDVTVSPDGTTLAFISDRGGSMQIWLHNLQTNDAHLLTERANGPRYPTFSPDGSQMAYQRVGPRGMQDFTVRVLDLATGKSRKLRSSPKIWPGRMSWSANGRFLTVAELHMSSGRATGGSNQLVRLDVANDTATVMNLPDHLIPDFGPVASPDGRHLALIADGTLWRMPVDMSGRSDGTATQVLNELVESPTWSWDGERITVLSWCGLESIDLHTGERNYHDPQKTWQPVRGNGLQIIHAGRAWDGTKDTYLYNIDIVIDGARITEVRPHTEHAKNIPVIDASDQTALPGLIDHHVHFEPHKGEWVGRSLLAFGVTTAVEPGGLPYESREHMESWLSGRRSGPRLVFAGPQLDGTRRTFYFASHINTQQRLQWELERGDRLGYGLLKTYRRMRPELQAATVQLGHDHGLPVTAHAALRNIGFGGDRTEHLRGSSRLGMSTKQSDLLNSYGDIHAIFTTPQASITPTLINQGGFFDFALTFKADGAGLEDIKQYTALYTPAYRKNLADFTRVVSKNIELIRAGLDNAGATLRQFNRDGVTIVAGTDSPIFPYGLALIIELQAYVDAGLTPAAALRTATSNAAKSIGAGEQVGGIQQGMLADIIIVDGDPLTNITDLFNIQGVMLNGQYRRLEELL